MKLVALALLLCACEARPDAPPPSPSPSSPEAFDRYRRPDLLVAALGLRPGGRVVDVGAGRGYLTRRLAEAVGPTGRVVATDIDAEARAVLRGQEPGPGLAPVETRVVPPDDPGLGDEKYDVILLSEVDQYLPDRRAYLVKLRRHLAPGGRIAVCNRRAYRAPLLAAAAAAGLAVLADDEQLPAHHLVFLGETR